jgi:hypothetical protein
MDLLTTYTHHSELQVITPDIHILQITTAPAKNFPACCVLTSFSLATVSNSGDSSASRALVTARAELLSTVNYHFFYFFIGVCILLRYV